MKFFERFKPAKAGMGPQDPADFDTAHQGIIDAAKSHNSTLVEVAETRKIAEGEMTAGIQSAREGYAAAVVRAENIDLLKERAQLTARNQLSAMKIEHATLNPEELQLLHSEVDTNTARIGEIESIVAKAIQKAKEGVK